MKLSLGLSPRDYSVAGGAVAYDADALAYFTANTAITSAADKNAINTFYLGLKSDGIYTKIKAMYLPIWGSAASCKWNLVNPLDTNAAFRMTFATGWTYSSSGITPTNTYARTYMNVDALQQNSCHFSYYSRTNAQSGHDAGAVQNASPFWRRFELLLRYTDNNSYNSLMMQSAQTAVSVTDSKALWLMSRTNSTQIKQFKNGALFSTNNQTSVTPYATEIWLGQSNGQSGFYSNKQVCFSSLGDGLTDTEATNFSNRINTLMTYFGINTY